MPYLCRTCADCVQGCHAALLPASSRSNSRLSVCKPKIPAARQLCLQPARCSAADLTLRKQQALLSAFQQQCLDASLCGAADLGPSMALVQSTLGDHPRGQETPLSTKIWSQSQTGRQPPSLQQTPSAGCVLHAHLRSMPQPRAGLSAAPCGVQRLCAAHILRHDSLPTRWLS